MAYEPKEGQGSLFRNERKQQPNHPDYQGQIFIGGVEYWISAWVKESQGGKKFFSISSQPKERPVTTSQQQQSAAAGTSVYPQYKSDDLPF